jgi:spore maturation protein SpmB
MRTYLRSALAPLLLVLLAGCSARQEPTPNGAPAASTNAAVFDPTMGNVPLPNILATATATDPLAGRAVDTPMTPAEALAYINLHEVGGTNAVAGVNAPNYLQFTYPVQPATVTPANIKVFQLTPDPAGTENNPLGFTDVTALFTFQYPAGGTDLWLFPSFPLLPATRYLYVVTNRVLDAATGAPIIPSVYFQYLQSATLPTGAAAPLDPIWANATSGSNILLSGYGKVMNDLIAASATTTITSRTDIAVMGRFITSGAGFIEPTTAAPSTPIPVETALRAFAAGGLPGGLSGVTWNNAISITTTLTGSAALGTYWNQVTGAPAASVPASIGAIVLGSINAGLLGVDPVVVSQNAGTLNLAAIPTAYNDAAGVVQPFRALGVLVGYYYVPNTIPFVYVVPASPAPGAGYPLVLYQHGITSQKETVLLLAQALTETGFAALAIDLPMHGALSLPSTTPTQWGEDFMAVGMPLATRSNIEQAAFNLDRLEFTVASGGFSTSLATAGLPGYVPDALVKPHFVGISLGSIVGAYYLAGNTTLAASGAPYTQTTLGADMKGFLSVPGGRLAYLIQNSPAFGPTVNAGLAADGINVGTPIYNEFFQVTQTVVDTADPATMTTPLAAGLPSRLSGRLLMQEATSTTFNASGTPTNGDLVITNPYTRYFGNALGGLGLVGDDIAPGFFQLGYGAADTVPVIFMDTLSGASPVPKDESAALLPTATSPNEGYFEFDQPGIEHGALIDLSTPATQANAAIMQLQMLYFLGITGTSLAVDPTQSALALP